MPANTRTNMIGKWGLKPAIIGKKNKKIENSFQKGIVKELIFRNFIVVRINSSAYTDDRGHFYRAYKIENLNMSSGLADLMIIKKNKVAFLEIKKDEKQKLSANQKEVAEYFNERGTPYFKVGSVEELNNCLKLLEAA